jgi:SAM-dependent methyltransferase
MTATMDTRTVSAYDQHAAAFANDWHDQPPAADMHALIRQYFRPGRTADVGCGSGRDTAWLSSNGFPAVGFEPSNGLLAEARRRHPEVRFEAAALPELAGVLPGSFVNVLCETVIMHLQGDFIAPSVRKLLDIIEPGGTLYLSWRVTEGGDRRDDHGRLYAAFDPQLVLHALSGAVVVLDEQVVSPSSGKAIRRIVARKKDVTAE